VVPPLEVMPPFDVAPPVDDCPEPVDDEEHPQKVATVARTNAANPAIES